MVSPAAGQFLAGHRSVIAQAAARAGLPVSVVVGVRFALEPGRGPNALPVRPALLASVAGVFGVVAAFTFSAGVSEAAGNPARFGQTQQLEIYLGFGGDEAVRPAPVLAAIARDPAVAAVNDSRIQVARSGDTTFAVFTYAPVGAPLATVLSEGRLPARQDEIVLGRRTAAAVRARVGSRVSITGSGTVTMTVTGIGFVPAGLQNGYTEGGWVTAAAYDRLFAAGPLPYMWHVAHIAVRPGIDPAVVAARVRSVLAAAKGTDLARETGVDRVNVGVPAAPPMEIIEIRDVAAMPALLGGFLAALAAGAIGHALATAVRRRRHELAVLRALGMTRPQARLAVVVQAVVLAMIGLLFGVPLGLAVGRTVWRLVADVTPLQYVPPTAPPALVLIAPATLLLAALLAAWPGRAAARLPVARALGTE
jgi:hypothetical protein